MLNVLGIGIAGLVFASWMEVAYVGLLLLPLAFFGYCTLYVWRLLLCAAPARRQVAMLTPPERVSGGRGQGAAEEEVRSEETEGGNLRVFPTPDTRHPTPAFAILIPAHNEELLLGTVLEVLGQLEYPRSAYRVIVIADNCSDHTAEIARAHGAIALERFNDVKIGKGYALEWALQALQGAATGIDKVSQELVEIANFGAVVILDADTFVSHNMLTAFAQAMASGEKVFQVRYDVLNTGDSWRTRLMSCALAVAHLVKPLGRERLKLSDGLKGNGMCFTREVVEKVPWSGESITEDIEYTLRLCRAGYRVAFLPEATVWAQMPTSAAQSVSQRKRWEGGRYSLLFHVAPVLLRDGFRQRNPVLRDRAMELIVPPFAEMFALPFLGLVVSALTAMATGWHWAQGIAWLWGGILGLQALYLLGGMWLARIPFSVALSILYAPFYIVWKFGVYAVMAVNRSAGGWKRTERHGL